MKTLSNMSLIFHLITFSLSSALHLLSFSYSLFHRFFLFLLISLLTYLPTPRSISACLTIYLFISVSTCYLFLSLFLFSSHINNLFLYKNIFHLLCDKSFKILNEYYYRWTLQTDKWACHLIPFSVLLMIC